MGWYYLIAADRLSCWTEVSKIRQGTDESGYAGLCTALRKLFSTFGVPREVSSDGGPEFSAKNTEAFFRWGIHHRKSSSYLPSSNGRAEVAVKSTKRLLMKNISPNGSLDTDKMVRALLMLRNTPDPTCKLSPAEVIFGRHLVDSLARFMSQKLEKFHGAQEPIFTSHKSNFNIERYRNNTALSAEVWRIKDLNGQPTVSWRTIRKSKAFTPDTKRCNLCLAEKFEIANYPDQDTSAVNSKYSESLQTIPIDNRFPDHQDQDTSVVSEYSESLQTRPIDDRFPDHQRIRSE
ncbi:uncharacterized protein [Clytia hemisphaerica]|uniref:uncharacterized protein n=1 Tax=Clytia hemisphaerica TaxID=252671 RepID=UPI0034D62E81